MIPVELSQDSTGAPALDGSSGSLVAVLKFALPQLGWTLEFESGDGLRAVFRNSAQTGTGYYLRVIDDPATGAQNGSRQAQVQAYADMTDVDTGTDPHPDPASGNAFWSKTKSNTSGATNWRVIGTDTFFWWLPDTIQDDFSMAALWYAGDVIPISLSDINNFVLGAHTVPDPIDQKDVNPFGKITGDWNDVTNNAVVNPWTRRFDGAANGGRAATVGFAPGGGAPSIIGRNGDFPDRITGDINTSRIYLSDSNEGWSLRGLLPGILQPLVKMDVDGSSPHSHSSLLQNISNGRNLTNVRLLLTADEYSRDFTEGAALIDVGSDWSNW